MTPRKPRGRGKTRRQTEPDRQTIPSREGTFETSLEFPVVGIGASAGGLDAFTQFLEGVEADTGMAFVLIQHLAPNHPSSLAEIVSRATRLPVTEGQNESPVLPNHIYVIPPGWDMIIVSGKLKLSARVAHGQHRPIDLFLHSLAEDRKHLAIAVVLSGTGTDGTIGLQAIKAEGGITFAQDVSAQHQSMPRSAIASGCVDFVLSPIEIGHEITRIARSRLVALSPSSEEAMNNLSDVVKILHAATGIDFSHYKPTTLRRRIARRMVLRKTERFTDYANYLRRHPHEVEDLYQDILIHVTRFFRDPESYEALKTEVFPELVKNKSPDRPVRIWSLGCSTGEEAYSLAIALTEFAESIGIRLPAQIFATDLNEASVQKARTGAYPKHAAQDISAERLHRFFYEVDGKYRITKSIREICVFSKHNVLADPPFARIDLISCRNLLIYLEPVLQQYLMPVLRYALNPNGFLWLGASETIGSYRDLFEVKDPKHKIYVKRPGSGFADTGFRLLRPSLVQADFEPIEIPAGELDRTQLYREGDRILLARYSPPSVLISSNLEVLQFRGDTSPYLAAAPGRPTQNLLRMLREGLLPGIHAAITKAASERAPVREQNLQVKVNGGFRNVSIEVIPINGIRPDAGGFLILFVEPASPTSAPPNVSRAELGALEAKERDEVISVTKERQIERRQQELAGVRDYLQSVIERQEAANEDLQSANEEVQSANEELQSVNEELETSKEEIESSNEELVTVNDELNNRNLELNLLLNARRLAQDEERKPLILLAIEDVTVREEQKSALVAPAEEIGRSEELTRANRNKDEFLAMLAHELRNPLAPLSNAMEIIASPDIDAHYIEEARKVARRQVKHLTRLIDDLLDISRITQHKIELRKTRVELASILKGAAELSRSHLQVRGQTLDFPIPEQSIYVEADDTRLEQVFGNLLNNASKFSDNGAVISLYVEASKLEDQTKQAVVRVRDTGIGIDPEVLPHVFDLFVQGNRSLDRSYGGLGIGLTLVRQLVELHGGTVEAHSEGTGRGSEFIVRLPVLLDPVLEAQAPRGGGGPASRPAASLRRILVVDDHEDSVTMMAAILRSRGYEVATARTGIAALEIAPKFSPEIIILDIGLPEIDGYEIARRFRNLPATGRTFIIALSGYGTQQDRIKTHEAGFDEHLTKPVAPAELFHLLSRV